MSLLFTVLPRAKSKLSRTIRKRKSQRMATLGKHTGPLGARAPVPVGPCQGPGLKVLSPSYLFLPVLS